MSDTRSAKRQAERKLIARAIKGDREALGVVVEANRKQVYALCLRMTRNVPDAEDLTQDAFVQVLSKLNTFRGNSALSTWIYRVAMNTTLMHFRKRQFQRASLGNQETGNPQEPVFEIPQTDRHLKDVVHRLSLIRALEGLPAGCRTMLLLHDVEGYAHCEIARILRCAIGTSKSQLHKARQRMRLSLQGKASRKKTHIHTMALEERHVTA